MAGEELGGKLFIFDNFDFTFLGWRNRSAVLYLRGRVVCDRRGVQGLLHQSIRWHFWTEMLCVSAGKNSRVESSGQYWHPCHHRQYCSTELNIAPPGTTLNHRQCLRMNKMHSVSFKLFVVFITEINQASWQNEWLCSILLYYECIDVIAIIPALLNAYNTEVLMLFMTSLNLCL